MSYKLLSIHMLNALYTLFTNWWSVLCFGAGWFYLYKCFIVILVAAGQPCYSFSWYESTHIYMEIASNVSTTICWYNHKSKALTHGPWEMWQLYLYDWQNHCTEYFAWPIIAKLPSGEYQITRLMRTQHQFGEWLGADKPTSHCLNQLWPIQNRR